MQPTDDAWTFWRRWFYLGEPNLSTSMGLQDYDSWRSCSTRKKNPDRYPQALTQKGRWPGLSLSSWMDWPRTVPFVLPLFLGSTSIQPAFQLQSADLLFQPAPPASAPSDRLIRSIAVPVPRLTRPPQSSPVPTSLLVPNKTPPSPSSRLESDAPTLVQLGQHQPVLPPKPVGHHQLVPLRVAIAKNATSLDLGITTPAVITDHRGNRLSQLPAKIYLRVKPEGSGLRVAALRTPAVIWIQPTTTAGVISVDGRPYRGAIKLILDQGTLLAVNHVDLESYLYSVVGAEMPASWSLEALKAQAIAARSYALAHIVRPTHPDYDLGATPQWQAYEGLKTETDSTRAAVNETRGLLLSYQGSIVKSLYAASDQLVREAHNGFGMSQQGANHLAQNQFNYQQILDYFYPDTQLAWIRISS